MALTALDIFKLLPRRRTAGVRSSDLPGLRDEAGAEARPASDECPDVTEEATGRAGGRLGAAHPAGHHRRRREQAVQIGNETVAVPARGDLLPPAGHRRARPRRPRRGGAARTRVAAIGRSAVRAGRAGSLRGHGRRRRTSPATPTGSQAAVQAAPSSDLPLVLMAEGAAPWRRRWRCAPARSP